MGEVCEEGVGMEVQFINEELRSEDDSGGWESEDAECAGDWDGSGDTSTSEDTGNGDLP